MEIPLRSKSLREKSINWKSMNRTKEKVDQPGQHAENDEGHARTSKTSLAFTGNAAPQVAKSLSKAEGESLSLSQIRSPP